MLKSYLSAIGGKKVYLILSLLVLVFACSFLKPQVKITDFESCVKAKNPILETFPRQCRAKDGQLFVAETDVPIWVLAESELPASGVCAPAGEEDAVRVEINQDVPNPRCQKLNSGQRLIIKNNTEETVLTWFGLDHQYSFNIPAKGEYEVSQSVMELLAPGVHILYSAPYAGPEIWVNN